MSHKIIWTGTRESDILATNDFFSYSITTSGSNENNNISFSFNRKIRINYNKENKAYVDFLIAQFKELINEEPQLQIMYYNPAYAYNLEPSIRQHVCCLNPIELINLLRSKCDMRMLASKYIPIVPFELIEGKYLQNTLCKSQYPHGIILQENVSSGGEGTYVIHNPEDYKNWSAENNYLVSSYYAENIPININFIIFDEEIVMFPPSVQIIEELNGKLLFMGSDYFIEKYSSFFEKQSIYNATLKLAKVLQKMGYRGICGFDYIYVENQLLFLECNPRFQASTFLLNLALQKEALPSVQELNYMAFNHLQAPEFDYKTLNVPYSCISYIYQEHINNSIFDKEAFNSSKIYNVLCDGYDSNVPIENDAYLYRIIFSDSISAFTSEHRLITYDNLVPASKEWYDKILSKDILALKISLLNQGIRISKEALEYIENNGGIKSSVFESIDVVLSNGMIINCPYKINYAELSPFTIELMDGTLFLQYYGNILDKVSFETLDIAREYRTKENQIPYRRLSYLGGDRLRIHHTDICHFKRMDRACHFCNLPTNGFEFNLSDIYEVIDYYLESCAFRHILIGGGSNKLEDEYNMIMEITKYIRSKSNLPIYVMCLPINDEEKLIALYKAGVNEIGFNIELWETSTAKNLMPAKGNISRETYMKALVTAKRIWKKDYAVRTLLIVGIEHRNIIKEAVEKICSNGILPILSVFRPLPNSYMENYLPPRNMYLYTLYEELDQLCKKHNQKLGPDCVPCQNNTLSLPW